MLQPLNAQESIEYINFRLRAVNGAPGIFEGKALRRIVEASAGNPRRLNVLSHNALLLAYSKGAKTVSVAAAFEVVADYEGLFRPPILLQAENDASTQSIERPFKSSRRKSYAAVAIVGMLAASSAGALKHASTGDPVPTASSYADYAETAISAEPAMSFTSNVTSQPGNKMSRPMAGVEISPKAVTVVTASSAAPAEQSTTKRTQIQIHAGDTFHDLAVRYLGSIDRTRELIMANPQIRNPDVIVPGQIVYLPSAQSAAAQE